MLSILIPIYNYNISKLVNEIIEQAKECNIDFEIIAADDASEEKFRSINSEIVKLKHVSYIQLNENLGRSKIRNLLASAAKYEYLLFMDSDSFITNKNFVSDYINHTKKERVICGGKIYQNTKPKCKDQTLRWYYGIKREAIPVEIRKKDPYTSFMTNNFLVPKAIFQKIKFDESLSGYGHEDTLFGIKLLKYGVEIKHINNPLIHKETDHFNEFLDKTNSAISNLIQISKGKYKDELYKYVKLLRNVQKLHKFKIIINLIYYLLKPLIIYNLKSYKPNLHLFDFYKLRYYFACQQKNN